MTNTRKIPPLLCLSALMLLALSCATGRNSRQIKLTSEPAIESAITLLKTTPSGKTVMDFLEKNPARIEFASTTGLCVRFSFASKKIYLPRELKDAHPLLALELARAAYIYAIHFSSSLDEQLVEEEEMGSIFQARTAIEIKISNKLVSKNPFARNIAFNLCSYLQTGAAAAATRARNTALSQTPQCGFPLETLRVHRGWLEKTRLAMDNGTFYDLLSAREMRKVQKGVITMDQAIKNNASLRSMPVDRMYRYQRNYVARYSSTLETMSRTYLDAFKEDEKWRKAHAAELAAIKEDFSACVAAR